MQLAMTGGVSFSESDTMAIPEFALVERVAKEINDQIKDSVKAPGTKGLPAGRVRGM